MASLNFTPAQERAADIPEAPDKPVIVSAAAGSGKTAVLVERAVRLICDAQNSVPADKIVLVTFTRKAAGEIKERLSAGLKQRLNGDGGLKSDFLREQLILLEEAKITTINAFCLAFLKENAGLTGDYLTENIDILSEEECDLLSKSALDDTLEAFFSNASEEDIKAASDFFCENGDSGLQAAIKELYRFTRNLPDYNGWTEKQRLRYNDPDMYYKEIAPLIDEPVLADNFKSAVKALRPFVLTLMNLYEDYAERFAAYKRGAGGLDFNDCEHLTLELLRRLQKDDIIALERIRDNYRLIIVDEFQDSNFLQYEIFRLLDGGRNRLYFVGDKKQSVYGFRGAEPEVFDCVTDNPEFAILYLSENFRSSDEVINAVNAVFGGLMTREYGGADYGEKEWLKAGLGFKGGADMTAELCLLDKDGIADVSGVVKTYLGLVKAPVPDGAEAEAFYTGLRIIEMVSSGFEIFGRDGKKRACQWGDFAVLTSAGEKNFRIYEKAFALLGIPAVHDGGMDYLKVDETGTALDLLAVIDNPYDDMALFNVMMSPIFGFNADDMAQIRLNRKKIPLYTAVINSGKTEKTTRLLDTLSRLRQVAADSPVTGLIREINASDLFLPLIADAKRNANLRLLSFYADKFAQTKADGSLPSFLAYIRGLKGVDARIKQAVVSAEAKNSVRFMTIHGAKGLEFPVCFIGRVNQKFNFGNTKRGAVRLNKTAGITARLTDTESLCRIETLHYKLEENLNRENIVNEEMRKLYVAATRARDKLIFTGSLKYYGKSGKINADSYAEWLCKADTPYLKIVNGVKFNVGEKEQPALRETEKSTAQAIVIARKINAAYPRRTLCAIPRKLTATQVGVIRDVVGSEADEPEIFPRNPSFYGEKRLTGKKRGDAYHKTMELIDFKRGELEKQLLEIKPRFTDLEYRAVNVADIARFFASELGRRAVKSEKLCKEYKLYTEIGLDDLGVSGDFTEKPFVQGIADMFFYEDGEIVLVDYKTNRNVTRERLTGEYKGQLTVYRKAIEEMTGDKVKECWLYSFELGEIKVMV